MAIYHAAIKPIRRSAGRSAVGSAAYRIASRLVDERTGEVHDYSSKQGVDFVQTFLPEGVTAEWALDTAALWNAAEAAEVRRDARVAREIEVALPHELSSEQRTELVRIWSQHLADEYGVAVQAAIHAPVGQTDERNHHAHIMLTRREIGPDGFGKLTRLEIRDGDLRALGLPTGSEQYKAIRMQWADTTNRQLALAGLDVRIDHRSFRDRGLDLLPTKHMGVRATELARKGRTDLTQIRVNEDARTHNARLITDDPTQVLKLLTDEKSVFDRRDIARCVNRYIDDPDQFQVVLAKVLEAPELIELQPAMEGNEARLSTRDMIDVEVGMASTVDRLAAVADEKRWIGPKGEGAFSVGERHVRAAVEAPRSHALAPEQIAAVRHVTGPERVSCVVGLAGAGKSTMLGTAKLAWEANGHRVLGATLAGKAAEELQAASGIESRTLASYQYSWERDPDRTGPSALRKGDVLVVDEAGMVGSRQMAEFIAEVDRAGAKVVLVGDPEQLQPINAGAAFRSIMQRTGFAQMDEVRRQQVPWQRDASVDLARHNTAAALRSYIEHGQVGFCDTRADARERVVADVVRDRRERPDDTRMVLTHRRADVRELNLDIRTKLLQSGDVGKGDPKRGVRPQEKVVEVRDQDPETSLTLNPNVRITAGRTYETNDGARDFATGDRFLFLENDRTLGVKNGMLGTVTRAGEGEIVVRLDARDSASAREVVVPTDDYQSFDHGYATTIHKSQGSTVDRTYVLASPVMDRHLTYVAMTRHRDDAQLYAGRDDFKNERSLIAVLGRENLKETTLDYGVADGLGPEVGQQTKDRSAEASSLWERCVAIYANLRGIDREIIVDLPTELPQAAVVRPQERNPASHDAGQDPNRGEWENLELANDEAPDVFANLDLTNTGPSVSSPVSEPTSFYSLAETIDVQRYARAVGELRVAERNNDLMPHQRKAATEAKRTLEATLGPRRVADIDEAFFRAPRLANEFGRLGEVSLRAADGELERLTHDLGTAERRAAQIRTSPELLERQQTHDRKEREELQRQRERARIRSNSNEHSR